MVFSLSAIAIITSLFLTLVCVDLMVLVWVCVVFGLGVVVRYEGYLCGQQSVFCIRLGQRWGVLKLLFRPHPRRLREFSCDQEVTCKIYRRRDTGSLRHDLESSFLRVS